MAKHKCLYTFAARSRAAMVEYIFGRKSHCDNWKNYTFAWNVKAYKVNFDRPRGEYALQEKHQAAWEAYVARDNSLFWQACEDVSRHLTENEYSTYPGDDHGQWEFGFIGRSGGWLVLLKWSGRDMRTLCREDLDEWTFANVRTLYRALVCMDQDFTRANAEAAIETEINYRRGQWEEERDAEEAARVDCMAARMVAERPDLYPEAG